MTVRVDAARTNRSLTGGQPDRAASLRHRRTVLAQPVLMKWRRLIDTAEAEAKKTRDGFPTDTALSERWWIEINRPSKPSPEDHSELVQMLYAGSFDCCCEMLGLDAKEERKRIRREIKAAWLVAFEDELERRIYDRTAAVLRCQGVPARDGDQYALGLVHPADYEEVADPEEAAAVAAAVRRERRVDAGRARRRRAQGSVTLTQTGPSAILSVAGNAPPHRPPM